MLLIPEESIALLPFRAEPISDWEQDELDLLKYIHHLFNRPATIVDPDGNSHEGSLASYSNYLLAIGQDEFRGLAVEFLVNARKNRPPYSDHDESLYMCRTGEVSMRIPDFWTDESFGLMAKYTIGWDATMNAIVSEGMHFSIAHVFESGAELSCSILLASNMYYKQALQVLRNFLEHHVVQLYFCDNETEFTRWKNNEFRLPRFRGRDGMLTQLVSKGVLPDSLASVASDLYASLNGCIHGAEHRLIYHGMFSGEKSGGTIFSHWRFREWCDFFAQCADFGMRTLKINVEQWQGKKEGRIRCSICHNREEFDIRIETRFDRDTITLICLQCENSSSYSLPALVERGLIEVERIDDSAVLIRFNEMEYELTR